MEISPAPAQINPTVGDIAGNSDRIRAAWGQSATADVVVTPELAITGYPPGDLLLRGAFLDALDAAVMALAAESADRPPLLLGAPHREGGRLYNAVHLLAGGRIAGTTRKHRLPSYGVFGEHRLFAPGPLPAPLALGDARLGLLICEDMWDPEPAAQLAKQGATQLIAVNASPFEGPGKHELRLHAARARVAETGLALAYVNQVGGQDGLVFDGGSFALDAHGDTTLQAPFFEKSARMTPPGAPPSARGGSVGAGAWGGSHEGATVRRAITLALKDYARKNGFSRAVLGLSGGVDSALTAAIAADALGAEGVHAIAMPTRFTADQSLQDARALAKNLGIVLEETPIEPALQAMESMLGVRTGLPHENLQARIRGAAVMARANATGALALATGNKSELAVGYCTLYGDMCGGFAPLGDLYKTRVTAMASADARIPRAIVERAPTAELRAGQADADSLPPYPVLDAILEALIEDDAALEDVPHDRATVERVFAMLTGAEHKRRQAPPAPKVTPRALRGDRRWPITLGARV